MLQSIPQIEARARVNPLVSDTLTSIYPSGPTIFLPATLASGLAIVQPPRPATNIITPSPALFEYSNKKLLDLDESKRDQIMREMTMMFDNAIAYILGEKDRNAFAKSDGDFFRAVNRIANPDDHRREPRAPKPAFNFPTESATSAAEIATGKGKRLAKVLRDLLDLQVKPQGDTYDAPDGVTRYKLYSSRGADGVVISRRNPVHSQTWLSRGVAYTRREVAVCMEELDRQAKRALEGAEWKQADPARESTGQADGVIIPGKVVIERGPIVEIPADAQTMPASTRDERLEARLQANDARAREAFMRGAERARKHQ